MEKMFAVFLIQNKKYISKINVTIYVNKIETKPKDILNFDKV